MYYGGRRKGRPDYFTTEDVVVVRRKTCVQLRPGDSS